MGCHAFLQGLTQESNPGLLHCRQILYHLSYKGSPYIYVCVCGGGSVYMHTHIYKTESLCCVPETNTLFFPCFLSLNFIRVQLIHSAVLAPAVQQSGSAACVHVSRFPELLLFRSPRALGHLPVLSSELALASSPFCAWHQ